ncbi:MAG TPA: DUF5995 family protein [Nitriliruptorales bacterium]|nr:DUF5995 family protein [Nitriliruptorales bacterium]
MSTDDDVVAGTLQEVMDALEAVVDRFLQDASRLGYFAALYRTVTSKVAQGIAEGFFDDGERMQRLGVSFANRYLTALHALRTGGRPSRSWQAAFDAASRPAPIVLQHLLLAVNAHINLDLGIAAAEVAPGDTLPALRRDFDRINETLASMLRQVQRQIGEISPWVGLLDLLGGSHDDEIVRFSVEVARTQAWRFAVELAPLARDDWSGPIGARDATVARLARVLLRPGLLTVGLWGVRARESRDVRRNIRVLSRVQPPIWQSWTRACARNRHAINDPRRSRPPVAAVPPGALWWSAADPLGTTGS